MFYCSKQAPSVKKKQEWVTAFMAGKLGGLVKVNEGDEGYLRVVKLPAERANSCA